MDLNPSHIGLTRTTNISSDNYKHFCSRINWSRGIVTV